MSRETILLVGAGGHARACIDVIEQDGRFEIKGLVGLPGEVGSRVLGYPVLASDNELDSLASKILHAIVAIGHIKTPEHRIRVFSELQRCGYRLPEIGRAHV